MLGVLGHLAPDEGMQVETEIRGLEGSGVFLRDPAQLAGEEVDDLIEARAGVGVLGECLFEVQQDFVAQRAQARGHQEEAEAGPLICGYLTVGERLCARHQTGVGDRNQTFFNADAQTERHPA